MLVYGRNAFVRASQISLGTRGHGRKDLVHDLQLPLEVEAPE